MQIARQPQILLLEGHVSENLYRHMRPIGTETRRIRSAPKIHKDGVPLRPILCMDN
ncbi:hypothetical protein EG68_11165 [Paragonimus skrjabini miyazakii]|uniref:Uncharacterized protein n=1 Tax=Paragonimus skrjabini miyazakii TaxID=59628 RepID=A0A8S9YJ84_9TREM|nr:hypothetical protein EG68_11165 [Paragonimus skrjabini miyazakii]